MAHEKNSISHPIYLDYPVRSEPRYGWGKPPHPEIWKILNRRREPYSELLRSFLQYKNDYIRIHKLANHQDVNSPYWVNNTLPGLDAVSLYGFIRSIQPKNYFEIGNGNSTRFARQAISDSGLNTTITAIDPYPPADIETICDQIIQEPLEHVALTLFDTLESGDILFVDNSHRIFMNSDATVVFMDILPRLKPGILVEFHDIALPFDYPPYWAERYYSEQYVLAAYLLAEGDKFEVVLPNAFISMESELRDILNPLWRSPEMNGDKQVDLESIAQSQKKDCGDKLIEVHGSSFWIRTK